MPRDTRTVHNIDKRPRKRYLLGYIAAIDYQGHEWSLTKTGDYSSEHGPKEGQTHVWKTKAQALAVARKADTEKHPAYARPYAYESANPESAKGLALIETAEPLEWVRRNAVNELAFIRDCREYNAGESCVNPYVGNMTCYGVPFERVQPLLTANGVFHPTYNPKP